jgi:hypothetical protein
MCDPEMGITRIRGHPKTTTLNIVFSVPPFEDEHNERV